MALRISTMTGIVKLNHTFPLKKVYDLLQPCHDIKFIEFGENYKGDIDKKNLKKREKQTKKYFYNQITIHLWVEDSHVQKYINVKIFNNGSLQMTGINSKELGQVAIDKVIRQFNSMNSNDPFYSSPLQLIEYYISMINSDFHVNFKINRDKLNQLILEMGMYSSYEPCIYPGVNIKYYFKESKSHGICDCEGICDGKGLKGNCKKITIVAFNSGAVMITGGKDIRHYHQVYEFISKLLNENRSLLEHK